MVFVILVTCLLDSIVFRRRESRFWPLCDLRLDCWFYFFVRLFIYSQSFVLSSVTCLLMHVETLNFQWHQLCNFEDVFVLPVSDLLNFLEVLALLLPT